MRIAAVHESDGKVFGTIHDNQFKKLLIDGAPVRDLRQVIALVEKGPAALKYAPAVALDGVKLAAPVGPLAKNVMCVGKNYHDHAQEFARSGVDQSGDKQESPSEPVVFTKATSSLADPFQPISASSDPTHSVDYEGELGVVIGRRCKNMKRADALDYVFGYTVVNDITARAIQQRHKQWFLGKSLDGFCPVGPWLVTRDEMGPPDAQELATYVNGERRQFARAARHDFRRRRHHRDDQRLTSRWSRAISSRRERRPASVSASSRRAIWSPGDVVKVSISGIGELTNPFV